MTAAQTDPPFATDDKVVIRKLPGRALTVFNVTPADGGWLVSAGYSMGEYMVAPATVFAPVPAGYRNPPAEPGGSAAAGLSYRAWDAKREDDAADARHQAALCHYHREMIAWAETHAAAVNPESARDIIRTHKFLLDRSLARRAGRDPDAAERAAA